MINQIVVELLDNTGVQQKWVIIQTVNLNLIKVDGTICDNKDKLDRHLADEEESLEGYETSIRPTRCLYVLQVQQSSRPSFDKYLH